MTIDIPEFFEVEESMERQGALRACYESKQACYESKHTSLEKGYKHGRNRGTLSSMLQDRKRSTGQEGAAWNCSMETAGGHQAVPLLSKELKG